MSSCGSLPAWAIIGGCQSVHSIWINDCSPHEDSSLFGRRFGTHNLGKQWKTHIFLKQVPTIYKISTISLETPCPPSVSQRLYSAIPQILLNFEGEVVSCTWLTSSVPHSTMLWKGWGLSRVTSGWTPHDHAMCQSGLETFGADSESSVSEFFCGLVLLAIWMRSFQSVPNPQSWPKWNTISHCATWPLKATTGSILPELSEPSILEISGALLVVHDPIPAACPTGWKKKTA